MPEKWTKEDKEAFRRKDAQQARGYSVEQAIKILQAHLNVDEVLGVAEKVLNHTTQDVPYTAPKNEPEQKASDMSPKAKKVWDKLIEEYEKVGEVDKKKLEELILEKYGKLPTLLGSIKIVMKDIKPEDVILKEN